MGERRVELILLERQGLAKLVSDKLKHRSSQLGARGAGLRDEASSRVSARSASSGATSPPTSTPPSPLRQVRHWARRAVLDDSSTSATRTW